MIWTISWKNVWRNPVRSLVVIVAVTFGMISGIVGVAVMEGMVQQRIRKAVHTEVSHLQIHNPKFVANQEFEFQIEETGKLMAEIEAMPEVKTVSKRIKTAVTVQSAYEIVNINLVGIEPEREKQISEIPEYLVDSTGDYFVTDKRNPVFIGDKACENLKIKQYNAGQNIRENADKYEIPEEIIQQVVPADEEIRFKTKEQFLAYIEEILSEDDFTQFRFPLQQAAKFYKLRSRITLNIRNQDGRIAPERLRIAGIFNTGNEMFDGTIAYMPMDRLQEITGMDTDNAHEIAILLKDEKQLQAVKNKLEKKYPHLLVETYLQLSPEVGMMAEYMGFVNYFIILIILLALGFGIVNTMLMVVLERIKELGMLMAVGMNKTRVFSMIMLETVYLTLTGGLVGTIISAILVVILGKTGIKLTGDSVEVMESVGYASTLYPELSSGFYLAVIALVIFTGIVAAIYPARKALKLNPVEAIRIE